jgi:hypothetical protein
MAANDSAAPSVIVVKPARSAAPLLAGTAWVVAALSVVLVAYRARVGLTVADTPPAFSAAGPTVVQLERLQHLVSRRVRVVDVLVGTSRWLRGSWIVRGDALIGVDMSGAEIRGKDEKRRVAVVVLPSPSVLSPRVDHEATREWDVRSRTWVPLAAAVLGDREAMERGAMREAQRLVERAASSSDYRETARRDIEGTLKEFYGQVGWTITVQWK